jgi:hypothetical protein
MRHSDSLAQNSSRAEDWQFFPRAPTRNYSAFFPVALAFAHRAFRGFQGTSEAMAIRPIEPFAKTHGENIRWELPALPFHARTLLRFASPFCKAVQT